MNAPQLTRESAYRAGICVTCRVAPHSAGRPRCNSCHEVHAAGLESDSAAGIPGLIVITLEVATANA